MEARRTRARLVPVGALLMTAALLAAACGDTGVTTTEPLLTTTTATTTSGAPAVRSVEQSVAIDDTGLSEAISIEVPPGTRSIFVDVAGDDGDVIALGSVRLPSGEELFDVSSFGDVPALLKEAVSEHGVHEVPGLSFQEAGLGRYAWMRVAPAAGEVQIQVASTGDDATVRVEMPETIESHNLRLDVFTVNDLELTLIPALVPLVTIGDTFEQAGIEILWATIGSVEVPGLTEDPVFLEGDLDGLIAILTAAAAPLGTEAPDVFILEDLGEQFNSVIPSTPGPLPPSPQAAVIGLSFFRGQDTGRQLAHNLAHYLGLLDVQIEGEDGNFWVDQFDDTEPGENNFMEGGGRTVSEEQAEWLRSHPLITP